MRQDLRTQLEQRARALDQQYVPLLAGWVRRAVERTSARLQDLQRRRLTGTSAAELDERFAGTRPVQLVRDIPQLGFIVVAAVFLAGTATAVLSQPGQPRPSGLPQIEQPEADAGTRLGPELGETTEGYQATSRQDLKRLAAASPGSTRFALVSFSAYATPAQAQALLTGYDVRRVYVRSAAGGAEAAVLPYDIHGELGGALRRAYAEIALSRLAVQRSYLAYVATTTDDKAYHDDYARYAAAAGREVSAFQHSCACVFSAVVQAPTSRLLQLLDRSGVRTVQAAGRDRQLPALLIEPLLPETRGTVTKGPVP